jgi:hypothetical protein
VNVAHGRRRTYIPGALVKEEPVSDFLFAQPSFLSGMARVLDLGAKFDSYNISPSGQIADARAMFSDWCAVGKDIYDGTKQLEEQPLPNQDLAKPV